MPNLIDTSYFFGDILLPQKTDNAVAGNITAFVNHYEPEYLQKLLGYEMYKAFTEGLAETSPLAKWTELRDGKEYTNRAGILSKWKGLKVVIGSYKRSPVANYVYWHWMRNESTSTTGTGEKLPDGQNAVAVSSATKMVKAWNEMVTWNKELVEFLLSNPETYTEFENQYGRIPCELLRFQNILGI